MRSGFASRSRGVLAGLVLRRASWLSEPLSRQIAGHATVILSPYTLWRYRPRTTYVPSCSTALPLSSSHCSAALCACGGAQARKAKHLEKGQTYLDAGNYEKARVEFQNALQISPVDPEARFENGVVDEKLGKNREAAQFYQGTIDVSPDHLGARSRLARLYLFAGAPDKAIDLIKSALEKNPDNSELLTIRAAARVQQKDIDGGRADAERAVSLDPSNEDAVSALAGIYVSDKTVDRAQALLEGSIKKIPATVNLRLLLAEVYSDENRGADAEHLLMELVQLQPAEKAHRIRLAQFYARQKRPDDAERVLREGVKAIPDDRDMKLSLVDFLAAERSPEVAEKELQAMIAADPKDVELNSRWPNSTSPAGSRSGRKGLSRGHRRREAGCRRSRRAGSAGRLRAQSNDVKGTRNSSTKCSPRARATTMR